MEQKHPVDLAAEILGSQVALAALLDVSKAAVGQWRHEGRKVPAEHCPVIERATGGRVTCEQLRPDIEWSVLREPRATDVLEAHNLMPSDPALALASKR